MTRVLVITAVDAERDAVLARLGPSRPAGPGRYGTRVCGTAAGEVTVARCGVGPAAAAAGTAVLSAAGNHDLIISAGIAGGFPGRAEVGRIVIADQIISADLGADSPNGFLGLSELGFGRSEHPLPADLVAMAAARTGGAVGPVLTVSTATGTAERAAALAARHHAMAEAMEGAGVYAAGDAYGVPVLEVRGVSNLVGPRDPARWDVPVALRALSVAFADLLADPFPEEVLP
ncbi:MAG: futalosine hydrolase [Actinobacteria bacterium]|nr:futalosine hydrolase [Actinomycetota bacterium]MBI3688456.1 futalosine hydrolase [Actinomycetota bacterium]